MFQAILHLPYFWIEIWTADLAVMPTMYLNYVVSTFIVLLPLYVLLALPQAFGVKSKMAGKALGYLFTGNVALAIAPVGVPALIGYGLYRLGQQASGARATTLPNRRPRPARDQDDD